MKLVLLLLLAAAGLLAASSRLEAQNPASSRVVVGATAATRLVTLTTSDAAYLIVNEGPSVLRWGDSTSVAAGRGTPLAVNAQISMDLIAQAVVFAKVPADSAIVTLNRVAKR